MHPETWNGERVLWAGTPGRHLTTPPFWRAVGWTLAAVCLVTLCFALVVSRALQVSPERQLLFAGWTALLATAAFKLPRQLAARARYLVTERHVVVRRGFWTRVLALSDVSYVRVTRHAGALDTGDVEVVRAVPKGVLNRALTVPLRGVEDVDALLDAIQRRVARRSSVMWCAHHHGSWRDFLPGSRREWLLLLLSLLPLSLLVELVAGAPPLAVRLADAGLPVRSLAWVGLAVAELTTALLLAGMSGGLLWHATVLPAQRARAARYVITDQAVWIQSGREELWLPRDRIVDVVEAPAGPGLTDLYLVLDGPQARAAAAHGAFGERDRGPGLVPVLSGIEAAEPAVALLRRAA